MSQKRRGNATRSRSKKRTSVFGQHKRSVIIICAVLFLLGGVLAVNSVSLYGRSQVYKQQEAELQAQIKEQEERAEEVKEYEEYVKSDEYIKEVAEDKLGLVDPNEILFKSAE